MNTQERKDLIPQLHGAIYTTIDGDDVEYEGIYKDQGEAAAEKFNADIVKIVTKDYPIVEDDDGVIIAKEEFHSECFFHETTFENLSDDTLLELKKYMTESGHM